jgi:peptidylprolyl isomerase
MLRRPTALLLVLAASSGLVACGGDDETADDGAVQQAPSESVEPAPEVARASGSEPEVPNANDTDAKPEILVPEGEPPSELQTEDLVEGDGAVAREGDQLRMQYVGVSWSTGEQFDASWDNGEPFSFELGGGDVIRGWDRGIEGMRVGGRRLLVIPPDLGYGETGSPPAIAPNETLVFVVDLLRASG